LAGVQISAQTNYETGKRHPDAAYLSIIAAAGADVLYILTGERSGAASVLAPDEAALLDNYRHSPETGREAVRKTAFAFSQSHVMGKAA
jgi:transcriptional regulator with XRE-family HTH domain